MRGAVLVVVLAVAVSLAALQCQSFTAIPNNIDVNNAVRTLRLYSTPQPEHAEIDNDKSSTTFSRRGAVISTISIAAQLLLTLPILAVTNAAVMDSPQTVFKAGQTINAVEAEARLKDGRKSAQYLLDNFKDISDGGGDNVRRYLGTVGTSSGLFGIGKVMIVLADRADDFVEYTELSNEVLNAIQQADGSSYMASFVTSSTSYTPPSKYFGDAKIEVKRCIKAMDELAALIDVKI